MARRRPRSSKSNSGGSPKRPSKSGRSRLNRPDNSKFGRARAARGEGSGGRSSESRSEGLPPSGERFADENGRRRRRSRDRDADRAPEQGGEERRTRSGEGQGGRARRPSRGMMSARKSSEGRPSGRGERRPAGPARGKWAGKKRGAPPGEGPRRGRPEAEAPEGGGGDEPVRERLQKVLAAAGIASRRECEELIVSGRVEVDRKTVVELGTRVDPVNQEIRVDGVALPKPKRLYYAVHKPVGVVTTNYDPSGRPRVIDLIPTDQRVFPVGRLDRTSEGLLIVTNDGTLANLLTHPRYGVDKTYLALVDGAPDQHTLDKLREGVHIAEGLAKAASVKVKRRHSSATELIIVLAEGRNRQIRRMLARVGHKVLRLKRIAVGPLLLGDMPAGAHRKLSPQEVEQLLDAVKANRKRARKEKRRKPESDATGRPGSVAGVRQRPGSDQNPNRPWDDEAPDADGYEGASFGGAGDEEDVLLSEETLGARGTDSAGAVLDWNSDQGDDDFGGDNFGSDDLDDDGEE